MTEIQTSPVYYGICGEKKRCILVIFRRWKHKIKWEHHSKNISVMSGVKIETILDTGEQRFIPIGYPNEEEMELITKLRRQA